MTAGSFVRYCVDGEGYPSAGRIVEVVNSIDLVPNHECHPLIHLASPAAGETSENEIPVHFVKVNIFQDRRLFSDQTFPTNIPDRLVLDGIELSYLINFIGYRHTSLQAWHSLLLRVAMHLMIVKECCVF